MVSEIIKSYTKDNHYDLRWRFDFDNTLISVCNINGENYNINNLSEEDKEIINDEFCYLKNLEHFLKHSGIITNKQKEMLSKADKDCKYIEYVNLGWVNPDEKTYSYKQLWRTSDGTEVFDYEGNDAPLSSDGLFNFCRDTFPCITKVVEDGIVVMNYLINIHG